MGWIRKTEKPCNHPSRPVLPKHRNKSNEYMIGDIWECDICKQQFKVEGTTDRKYDQREGMYDVPSFAWRPN